MGLSPDLALIIQLVTRQGLVVVSIDPERGTVTVAAPPARTTRD